MRSIVRMGAAASTLAAALICTSSVAFAQKSGGILKMYHRDNPPTLSIHETATNSTVIPIMGVMNNLVLFDQNKPQNSASGIVPDLAKSWKWSPDGKALTFQLQEGVKWHDGKPFTAQDVVCTFDLLQGKNENNKLRANPRASWYTNVDKVTADGDLLATIHLKRPQPSLVTLLASGYSPIYPCHVPAAQMRTKPVGTGPFKLVEFKQKEVVRLARNPDYFKKGLPYLEPGTPVFVEDIEAWEKQAKVKIGPGDAILLRTGRWARREKLGPWPVPVNEAGWSREPFSGDVIDGFVWGRGAVDMLNLTATMAVAFRELAESGFRPRGDLTYIAVADEEAQGTWGADWLLEHHLDAVRTDFIVTGHSHVYERSPLVDGHYGTADCRVTRDLRELLARDDIDAVLVATGDRWHGKASMMAAEAGKDVYSEKPCGITIDVCQRLAATFRETGRVFQAGTQRRSVPNFIKAVEKIATVLEKAAVGPDENKLDDRLAMMEGQLDTMLQRDIARVCHEVNRAYAMLFTLGYLAAHCVLRVLLPDADPYVLPITAVLAAIGLTRAA